MMPFPTRRLTFKSVLWTSWWLNVQLVTHNKNYAGVPHEVLRGAEDLRLGDFVYSNQVCPNAIPPSRRCLWGASTYDVRVQSIPWSFTPPPPLSFSVQTFIQGGPSPGKHGLGWFWFGMFHHPAWAVGSYSSGHQPGELPKSQSTQLKFAKGWATLYREEIYSLQNLLSRTQEGPGRTVKKEQEEISPNHIHSYLEDRTFFVKGFSRCNV